SANATINNNNITIKGGGTTTQVSAIENAIGSTALLNTVSINNNTITGDYLTATSGVFYGIYNTASAATVNINNNTVQNISYSTSSLAGSGAVYPIWNSGAGTTINVNNNTVNNITRTGTTGGTTIGIYVSAGSTQNVTGNTVSNMSIDGSGTASTMYGIQTATGTITVNNNNVFNLQCIKTTGTSPLYGIYNISSPTNETINNNNVYNLTHNGTGIVYGIYHFTTTGTRTMAGNTVYNISGAGATIAGINNASSSPSVYNNRIYNIQSTSTGTPTVSGIIQGSLGTSGFANIYNNYISEIKAPSASFTTQTAIVRGINITTVTATTNVYVYYNTVYLNATSSGANFSSAAIFHTASGTATTANLIMRNNIFVNNSTPSGSGLTVAYWRSATQLNNYDNSSNNNLFYAGTPSSTNLIFYDGTNSDQTLAAYKTRVAPRDASSFTENPPFVNVSTPPYDLHIDPSTPTQVESGGLPITTPVAITTDYDGNIRNATTPDIGADEGNFLLLDLSPPSISYSLLGNGIVAGTRAFNNVTIIDPSGVNTSAGTKPRVYFKKKAQPNTNVYWKYVEADNSSSPFNFTIDYSLLDDGAVSVGDTIQYFVVAQDMSPAVNVGINAGFFANPQSSVNLAADAFPIGGTINQYAIVASISGTKTVGSGGDYPSLTGAGGLFADINSKVVSGNIVALILNNLTETGANALNQWSEEPPGSNFILTIAPNDASTKTISGNFAGGLIRLNGADRVTIDGRYSGAGNFLTFQNTNTTANSGVFQLISLGTGQGCANVTIRNTTIQSGTNAAVTFGIHAGGSSFASNGADHDNLSIIDNVINTASNGILVFGNASTSTGGIDNLLISGNSVTCSTTVQAIGIRVSNALNSTITQNTLDIQQTVSNAPVGISLETGVNNTTVSRNLIQRSAYVGTAGYGGRGITVGTGLTSSNITLVNNVIHTVTGDNWSAFGNASSMGIGIGVDGSTSTLSVTTGGVNIYYNSINMYNTFTRAATSTITAAIYIGSGSSNLNIRNNIFANSMDNLGNTTSKSYAIYSAAPATAFTSINYNVYFAPAPEGVLGFLTSDITTLSAWQTATGQDANSISVNPQFNSNTNLRPQLGSPVLAAGTPISGITTDFLGVTRSA
ncbi:MAG: hypothetical protein NZ108_03540, partial [Bacteroidia bacterium]|nr:hypothetical protein [Bacteroidia bacterium]